jgi:hypothetical protein
MGLYPNLYCGDANSGLIQTVLVGPRQWPPLLSMRTPRLLEAPSGHFWPEESRSELGGTAEARPWRNNSQDHADPTRRRCPPTTEAGLVA